MRISPRPMNNVLTILAAAAVIGSLAGCSRSYDTTQVDATGDSKTEPAPASSVVVETVPPTTVLELTPLVAAPSEVQSTLNTLAAEFAQNPDLVAGVKALQNGDMAAIAALLGVDLTSLSSLGMSNLDIAALGDSVLGSNPQILGLLKSGGTLDATALITLLTRTLNVSSLDVNGIAKAAVPQLIASLFATLGKIDVSLSPQIAVQLNSALDELDPDGLNDFQVTADNAPLVALITSVILANNPLFQSTILNNPNVSPELRELLKELESVNAELGESTSADLYNLFWQALFPA